MTYSTRSPAVKRLMKEAQELSEPTELFYAQPLEDNLFEWHFTIRGPGDTEFEGGIYHGRILLPTDYPMKPPNIMLLTPNGRFEVNRKICLSISGYHPESWRPSWSIRTAMLAIIGFMPTHGNGAIGSIDYSADERKRLAKMSQDFRCSQCGDTKSILHPLTEASQHDTEEAKDLATQIDFKAQTEKSEKPADSAEEATTIPAAAAAAAAPPSTTSTTSVGDSPALPPPPPPANFSAPTTAATHPVILPAAAPLNFQRWLEDVKGYVRQTSTSPTTSTTAAAATATSTTTPATGPSVARQPPASSSRTGQQQPTVTTPPVTSFSTSGPSSHDSYLVWSLAVVMALLLALIARRLIDTMTAV